MSGPWIPQQTDRCGIILLGRKSETLTESAISRFTLIFREIRGLAESGHQSKRLRTNPV